MEEFFTDNIGLLFWSAVQAGQVKLEKLFWNISFKYQYFGTVLWLWKDVEATLKFDKTSVQHFFSGPTDFNTAVLNALQLIVCYYHYFVVVIYLYWHLQMLHKQVDVYTECNVFYHTTHLF